MWSLRYLFVLALFLLNHPATATATATASLRTADDVAFIGNGSRDQVMSSEMMGERPAFSENLRKHEEGGLNRQDQNRRKLPIDFNFRDTMDRLFSTAPNAWTVGQWFLAVFLILLLLWCCGCVSGGRSQYRRTYHRGGGGYGGYSQQRSSGGCCECLQSLLFCFCCYELFCADCQDVPCCDPGAALV